jgi:hypothetical protein
VVTGAAEEYYKAKAVDKITRPEKIPPTLAELQATNDAIVTELQEGAESHIRAAAAELRVGLALDPETFRSFTNHGTGSALPETAKTLTGLSPKPALFFWPTDCSNLTKWQCLALCCTSTLLWIRAPDHATYLWLRPWLRIQVLGLGDLVAAAAEAAMAFLVTDGRGRVRQSAAAAAAAGGYAAAAAAAAAARNKHSTELRPGLALPSRAADLLALQSAENDRAHAAVDAVGGEAVAVAAALGSAAAAFERRVTRASTLMLALIGGLVMAADLPAEGAGAEAGSRISTIHQLNAKHLCGMTWDNCRCCQGHTA